MYQKVNNILDEVKFKIMFEIKLTIEKAEGYKTFRFFIFILFHFLILNSFSIIN